MISGQPPCLFPSPAHLRTPQICTVDLQTCTSGLLHEYCHICPPPPPRSIHTTAVPSSDHTLWFGCSGHTVTSSPTFFCCAEGVCPHLTTTVMMGNTLQRASELGQRAGSCPEASAFYLSPPPPLFFPPITKDLRAGSRTS